MFWFLLEAALCDFKLRVTQPVMWAQMHAQFESFRASCFWLALDSLFLLKNVALFDATLADVAFTVFWAWMALTEGLQAYFAYQDEHDDEDQDGDNYAWVH